MRKIKLWTIFAEDRSGEQVTLFLLSAIASIGHVRRLRKACVSKGE